MELYRVQHQFGTFIGEIKHDGKFTIIKKAAQVSYEKSKFDKTAIKTLITAIPDPKIELTGCMMIVRPSKEHIKIYHEARALLAGNGTSS